VVDIKLIKDWPRDKLVKQVLRVQERTALNLPRKEDFARLPNIDYFAKIEPHDACVGGDHLAIIDFKNYLVNDTYTIADMARDARKSGRHDYAATLEGNLDAMGIWIADAQGHDISASIPNTYLHGQFQIGIDYELFLHAQITADFFRRMNRKFYNWLQAEYLIVKPYVTMLYGEIHNDGRFRFIPLGHPGPAIFSNKYDKLVHLSSDAFDSSTPLGVLPSEYHADTQNFDTQHHMTKANFPVNEITLLGMGDILILYTDGLTEQKNGEMNFYESRLEQVLKKAKTGTAKEIYANIREELESYCPPSDDLTMVVIKKM